MTTPPLGSPGGPDPYKEMLPNQTPTTQPPLPSPPETLPQTPLPPEVPVLPQSSATSSGATFDQGFTFLAAAQRENQTHLALPPQVSEAETLNAKRTYDQTLAAPPRPTPSFAKRRPLNLRLDTGPSLVTSTTTTTTTSMPIYPTSVTANVTNLLQTQDITFVGASQEGLKVYNSECEKKGRGETADEILFTSHKPSSTQQEGAVGTSGSYFIKQDSQKIAVFKPADEEMGAANCPNPEHRLNGAHQRDGITVGQGVIRECIAPLLGTGMVTIPPTVLITLPSCDVFCNAQPTTEKRGSLQQFMEGANLHNDMSQFLTRLGASQGIQKQMRNMMIWDILVNNTDRNRGNVLVQGDTLISIDHGCIISERFIDPFKAFWLESENFNDLAKSSLNSEELTNLRSLNWEEQLQQISQAFPHLDADTLNTLRASYLLLIEVSEQKLTLKQIVSYFLTQNSFFPPTMHSIYNLAKARTDIDFNESFKQELHKVFTEYNQIKQQHQELSDEAIHQRINEELFTLTQKNKEERT